MNVPATFCLRILTPSLESNTCKTRGRASRSRFLQLPGGTGDPAASMCGNPEEEDFLVCPSLAPDLAEGGNSENLVTICRVKQRPYGPLQNGLAGLWQGDGLSEEREERALRDRLWGAVGAGGRQGARLGLPAGRRPRTARVLRHRRVPVKLHCPSRWTWRLFTSSRFSVSQKKGFVQTTASKEPLNVF